MAFSRGPVTSALSVSGASDKRGSIVHFKPDPEIFEELAYDFYILKQRLQETAFLTKGLKIDLIDEREEPNKTRSYQYKGGIGEFVGYINKNKTPLTQEIFYCENNREGINVE